ncbi:hypothetical protein MXB_2769 [Myxobolus squamalis]|nr:hypothetical protein MXB_2769 [Myxobolus squamalis]
MIWNSFLKFYQKEQKIISDDRKNKIEALTFDFETVKNELLQAKLSIESLNESNVLAGMYLQDKHDIIQNLQKENEIVRKENADKYLANASNLAQLSSFELAINSKDLEIFDLNDVLNYCVIIANSMPKGK